MEEYNNNHHQTTNSRGANNFLYSPPGQVLPPGYGRTVPAANSGIGFHLHNQYHQEHYHHHPAVKTEAGTSHNNHHHHHGPPPPPPRFHEYPASIIRGHNHDDQNNNGPDVGGDASLKAKIMAHPHYSNLLEAYMDCQKVGAPPEVVARLTASRQEFEARQRATVMTTGRDQVVSKDPELDQFMEAYYDMLVKYREELTRPLQEAMEFMRRIETQLNMLTNNNNGPHHVRTIFNNSEEKSEVICSSEDEQDNTNNSGGEIGLPEIDPRAEDRELKNHLLKKYSGYLSSLKQELSKKKKKGKLPKEARQKLLSWWELHYKWPYPSESEKVALAESTGLDQKQINNWFINQRKRHWKPSEDMQFMVMDGLHPQNAAALYMDGHYLGEGPYRLGP